jgi:hypothetical protein
MVDGPDCDFHAFAPAHETPRQTSTRKISLINHLAMWSVYTRPLPIILVVAAAFMFLFDTSSRRLNASSAIYLARRFLAEETGVTDKAKTGLGHGGKRDVRGCGAGPEGCSQSVVAVVVRSTRPHSALYSVRFARLHACLEDSRLEHTQRCSAAAAQRCMERRSSVGLAAVTPIMCREGRNDEVDSGVIGRSRGKSPILRPFHRRSLLEARSSLPHRPSFISHHPSNGVHLSFNLVSWSIYERHQTGSPPWSSPLDVRRRWRALQRPTSVTLANTERGLIFFSSCALLFFTAPAGRGA